ncbi:Cof-type HAD-IIB family hydrolase [Lacticaseibacillus sp. GG6-2]
MTRKLIALDLDGTTLNQAGLLSAKTVATLQKASAAGHLVVIATGRPDAISETIYDELHLQGPMINFNGALVHIPHQRWRGERQVAIEVPTALALRRFKREFQIRLMIAEGKRLLVADRGYRNVPFLPDMPHPDRLLNVSGLTQAPISVTMFIKETTLAPLQAAIVAAFPQLTPKTWGAWSGEDTALEVTAGQTGKAKALAYVASQYGIARDDIVAFGDDLNDLDMLAFAGVGVAMKNARPELLAVADAITARDNAADGVADYLTTHLAL